jgi:hypothetical protein
MLPFAPGPLGTTLPDSSERNPSGIPVAVVFGHGAVVSTSFPSHRSLGGSPLLRPIPLTAAWLHWTRISVIWNTGVGRPADIAANSGVGTLANL